MRRFYTSNLPKTGQFSLPEEESKHIVRVLRMELGACFELIDGTGNIAQVEIVDAHPKKCVVQINQFDFIAAPSKRIHLAICPTKNSDRIEWMVEKIVEIGATDLSFIESKRSERVQQKTDRLERVAISAMKQAQHVHKLNINPIVSFQTFVQKYPNGKIAHCLETNKVALEKSKIDGPILIGPEGDFTQEEIDFALNSGYEAVSLGTARLRTETAGMVAVVLATLND